MKDRKIEIFSEAALTILVSVVTLLLQLISFATTWSGSQIYLEGVFPYASLLFAIAIQATAYFFSNSLRNKVGVLKIAALMVAISCSTYYSYIGIYNSVNSPVKFLQEKYVQIAEELTGTYETTLEKTVGDARTGIQDAASYIMASYTALSAEKESMENCRAALAKKGDSYAEAMRAPRQSDYENYEDYVTAYKAYIAGISAGSNTEQEANRNGILASYGFASIDALQTAELENASALGSLGAALGVSEEQGYAAIPQMVSEMSVSLVAAVDEAMLGQEFDSVDSTNLNRLLQAAKTCGYEAVSASEVIHVVKRTAEATQEPLLAEYVDLVADLAEGRVTAANTMDLKSAMDSEILMGLLKVNSLLPEEAQFSYSDERYVITDLYLIPVQAIKEPATKVTALFCLGVAALIDMLSILFAISLRKRKPLWRRRTLLFSNQEDYMPQIYAALPKLYTPVQALSDFLSHFTPSPAIESDGYMMLADVKDLEGYQPLMAVLCQINMAKLVPVGLLENENELLLLKARFVFLANSIIYENKGEEREASA